MFHAKKYLSLFLAALCIVTVFAGCKIEVPAKVSSQAQSELTGTVESDSLLSQPESNAASAANSSSAAPSSKTQSVVSKPASTKPTSSKPVASTAVPKATSSSSSAPVDNKKYCTLMISCETILNHMNELDPATKSIIPANGILYAKQTIEFKDGDSVFDILKHERDAGRLKFEYQDKSAFNSVFIQSIGGLGTVRALNESGWLYCINGTYLNRGCSAVKVNNGDNIEWHYTCSTGRDLR